MIYTLTLNTAIDMNIRCQGLNPNYVNRTSHTQYSPNGKAVNVSIVLHKFLKPTCALGFFGGFSGKYVVDELTKMQIETKPCFIDDITRINVFINDGQNEYKLVGKGPFVPDNKKQELLGLIKSLSSNCYLVISGSLPNNIEPEYYLSILTLCKVKNIQVILDISHPILSDLLAYKPLLIKPNDDEIKEIFGFETQTTSQIITALENIHAQGAQNILLTMGARGLYFSNGTHIWFCNAVKIKLISSACAGDASLAAFLSEWLPDRENIERSMKKASATGANVAESDGLGLLDKICIYMNQIEITQIK
ncbi:1-phosphofructokinase family hexose kinase [Gilliamella sp. Nev3-1]|uniref:1-phosphofructokinase family hexose kinase n=1 Tax=Gilliamella sp. Nev3-1 TaxID=3120250 RepID=UPI00080DFA86|nr:1-phosphofructokinase [Gilliamella apicola]OCG59513.1 1-phosphofructokinase [Gilliamella apicola]